LTICVPFHWPLLQYAEIVMEFDWLSSFAGYRLAVIC
jgi:hypothetical protein